MLSPWTTPFPKEGIHFPEGFPGGSAAKETACNAGDPGLIPGSGRSPAEGMGYPLQYSWAPLVAQLVKNLPAMLETWVPSLGWEDPWRRERLPTPGFWPGESHGLYSPWSRKVSDTTEWLSLSFFTFRTWKQPRCPLTDERIRKWWYIYAVEYYTAV